jgi:signal transduction histidine kinase/response regulator RpfG family c-di-GMP phosphodiesterase
MEEKKRSLILLVDDSAENLDFLNGALCNDYDIIIARNGNQALRTVSRKLPELILLDIVMPLMDGYEVCSELKNDPNTANIPVIFLTGLANQLDKSRGFNLGAVDYITKPFNIVEVKARVKNQLLINQARHLLEQQNRQLESEVTKTTRKLNKVQENLEATEDKFRTLFRRSVNAIALCKPIFNEEGQFVDFIYQDVNTNYEKMVSLKRNKIIEKRESEIFDIPDPVWLETLREAVKGNSNTLFELHHKGIDKYVLGSAFNIAQDGDTFSIVLNDITERTLYQNQLIKAKEQAEESDRLKSAFLTNISHEIRTPLNGIIGFSQLMKQENITNNTKEHYIKIIEKCSRNLITVIDEIIEFSHIESSTHALNFTMVDLNSFLDNRLRALKEERDRLGKSEIEILSQFANEDGKDQFLTDRNRLKRIIDSLLSNALKFTENGSVTLGYKMSHKQETLTIFVKDTGTGISIKKRKIIFKSFRQVEEGYSREFSGIGLGLAISKKITGQLGGQIDVTSRPGKGSTFTLKLPYNSGREENNTKAYLNEKGAILRNKWGLIIDKDKFSSETLIRLLKLKEMNWIISHDLEEARRICRENPEIDVALINKESIDEDISQVPSLIQSFHKNISCLLLANPLLLDEKSQLLSWGYKDVINRPIEPEQLYRSLINCF